MLRDTITTRGGSGNFKQDLATGILLFFDQSRAMYVSAARESFKFGIDHKNINTPIWMLLTGGGNTLTNGYLVPRNGLITCLTVTTKNIVNNCVFRIRTNITSPDIITIPLIGTSLNTIDELNININQGDHLRVFADVISGDIDYPVLTIEVAWR